MSERNLILDTTYILPFFGVDIILTPDFKNELKILWKNGISNFKILLPSVCLIEVMYKLNREYRKTKNIDILKRYSQILPTIITSDIVAINHSQLDPTSSKIAIAIHHAAHPDLMDCWIAATAAVLKGILLTEDDSLKDILKTIPETKNVVCWSWNDLKNFLKI